MTHRLPSWHPFLSGAFALQTLIVISALCSGNTDARAGYQQAAVSVDASTVLGNIPSTQMGVNAPIWDGNMTDAPINGLLEAGGIAMLRYGGGSAADSYNWATNSNIAIPVDGSSAYSWNPNAEFHSFMNNVSVPSGAQPIITCNYGSDAAGTGGGDPTMASAWVHDANIVNHYGVKYWEIGNEVFANGYYSDTYWETDLHVDTPTDGAHESLRAGQAALSPTAYGTNVVTYENDMKAVDPTIKVGAVLEGASSLGTEADNWNENVLAACGRQIDFVVIHWYPEYISDNDAQLLLDPSQQIATMVSTAKHAIAVNCGSNASNVQIVVDETNSSSGSPGKQMMSTVQTLWLADNIQTWLENGAANVDYWDMHNGIGTAADGGDFSTSLFGTSLFGDEGMFSNGGSEGNISEPATDTPFAAYYGMQMDHYLGAPGDTMISSSSSQSTLITHATYRQDGSVAVMLENESPSTTYYGDINVNNYRVSEGGTLTDYSYGTTATSITSTSTDGASGSDIFFEEAPYAIDTYVLPGQYPTVPNITFPAGLQMVSLPGNFPETAESNIISNNPPMAAWDAINWVYDVAPTQPADTYRAGQGYWVRIPTGGATVSANTISLAASTSTVNLYSGWNIIGDPYSSAVPEADMSITIGSSAAESLAAAVTANQIDPTLYTFPAGATAYTSQSVSGSIQPFTGYWIYADQNCKLTYTLPSS